MLFSRKYWRATVFVSVFWFCAVAPYFAIGTFADSVLQSYGLSGGLAGGVGLSAVAAAGVVVTVLLIDRLGRRVLTVPTQWLCAAILAIIGLWAGAPPVVVLILFLVFSFFNAGYNTLTSVYPGEVFPTEIRGIGTGFAAAFSRVGAGLATLLLPLSMETPRHRTDHADRCCRRRHRCRRVAVAGSRDEGDEPHRSIRRDRARARAGSLEQVTPARGVVPEPPRAAPGLPPRGVVSTPQPAGVREMKDVAIVGGGLAGLSAAWRLRHCDTVLLESGARVGGRVRSERRGPHWLNWGGHVYAGGNSATSWLLGDTGVDAVPVPGSLAGLSMNGKLLLKGRVETYPFRIPMSWESRLQMVKAGMKVGLSVARYARLVSRRRGENEAARQQRVYNFMNDRTLRRLHRGAARGRRGALRADGDAVSSATSTRSRPVPASATSASCGTSAPASRRASSADRRPSPRRWPPRSATGCSSTRRSTRSSRRPTPSSCATARTTSTRRSRRVRSSWPRRRR